MSEFFYLLDDRHREAFALGTGKWPLILDRNGTCGLDDLEKHECISANAPAMAVIRRWRRIDDTRRFRLIGDCGLVDFTVRSDHVLMLHRCASCGRPNEHYKIMGELT